MVKPPAKVHMIKSTRNGQNNFLCKVDSGEVDRFTADGSFVTCKQCLFALSKIEEGK